MSKLNRLGIYKIISLVTFTLLSCTITIGQITVSMVVSSDSITIGDQIDITYIIKVPIGLKVENLDFSTLDSSRNLVYQEDNDQLDEFLDWEHIKLDPELSITDDKKLDLSRLQSQQNGDQQVYRFDQQISIFSVGVFDLERPQINVKGNRNVLPLQRPRVIVNFPQSLEEKDSLSLQPIKPIIATDLSIEDFLPYLYGLLTLAALFFLGKKLFKKKEKEFEATIIEEVILRAPSDVALEELQNLTQEELWQKGKIKEYQSRLTDIIRTYLEGRFEVKAMEMTTDEISHSLRKTNFDNTYEQKLKEILQMADLIKFAKAKPDVSIHDQYMQEAVNFVNDTKNSVSEKSDL